MTAPATITAVVERVTPTFTASVAFPGEGGVTVHNQLSGRSTADAHPDTALSTAGEAPMLRNAEAQDTYEGFAVQASVTPARIATTVGTLPYVITETGTNQGQINTNASAGIRYATVLANLAQDAAEQAGLTYIATDAGRQTNRFLRIGGDGTVDHDDGAFTTPNPGDKFTSGFFAVAVVRPVAPADNGQASYAEILTQTHDGGIGAWDNFEWALRWLNGKPFPFFEWTQEGGTSELLTGEGIRTGFFDDTTTWTPPIGQWSCIAVDLAFDVSGQWRGRHLRQVHTDEDLTIQGLKWKIVHEETGSTGPTSIDTGVTDDWAIGLGPGTAHVAYLGTWNGSAGASVFEIDPTTATVSDEIDDSDGNTWTAGPQAFIAVDAVPFDASGGAATTDASLLTSGTLPAARIADGSITNAKLTTTPAPASRTLAGLDLTADRTAAAIKTALAIAAADVSGVVPTTRTLAGLDLSADRTAAALRTALSLVVGTDVQAQSAILAALVANGTPGAEGLALLLTTTAAGARTALGLGTLATASTITSTEITDGTITAADLATALIERIGAQVRQTGDLASTSSTTLADIPGLAIPVVAGRTYHFDGVSYYNGNSSGDGRLGVTAPAGTLRVTGLGLSAAASALPGAVQESDVIDASGEYLTIGCLTGTRQAAPFSGSFACTTSGTLQFQGAQNTSNGSATTFETFGSRLTYTSHLT